jgi:uncharacterized protein
MKVARHDVLFPSPSARLLAGWVLAAALAGCASRPAEHFYTVSDKSAVSDPRAGAQRIAVSPVVIPALIDRPQLVVRTSGHEIAVLENHRWAEPLSVDLTRALIGGLRRVQPTLDIMAGEPRDPESDRILDVAIIELTSGPGPATSLQASWDLHDRARKCSDEGSFGALIPMQPGDGAIPAAYAEAMSRLAEAIAKKIPASHACAGN